ncbi:unnamed protein product [Brassicogethes aeneus]|uniref:Uncharacterized protein n=1 Tax=Brassicogethes aeneus TaxID=1431903 RepID=A0A9P0B010_BRAAE|nr:unnamed protein product [Brassicogethes aeneus]
MVAVLNLSHRGSEQLATFLKQGNNLALGVNVTSYRKLQDLKVVLLHKLNKKPMFPIAYSTAMKESYESFETILEKIKYDEYRWKNSCDLKVVLSLCLGHSVQMVGSRKT